MLKKILESALNFVYPPKCLHCHVVMQENRWLCTPCSELIDVLSPISRCPACFVEMGAVQSCQKCVQEPSPFYRLGAVCDYVGPAATLVTKMKYGQMPFLAESIAAFLTAQWVMLEWETPDYIIPTPISRLRRYERGYNQAALLAESLGRSLNIPVIDLLRRHSSDYSQAGLNATQRLKLDASSFYVKKPKKFWKHEPAALEILGDKTILLVDDVMTTGTTMKICAEILHEYAPKSIDGLTFCMTQQK